MRSCTQKSGDEKRKGKKFEEERQKKKRRGTDTDSKKQRSQANKIKIWKTMENRNSSADKMDFVQNTEKRKEEFEDISRYSY